MKKLILLLSLVMVFSVFTGCVSKEESTATPEVVENQTPTASAEEVEIEDPVTESTEVRFLDDSNREIVLEQPAQTVISLYSVHTENLFSLGLDDEIIGVGTSDKYPEAVLEKIQYSYKDDAELIIAANPDVVIVRSMIMNRYPDYIAAIEDAGITVVNLYCSDFNKFDDYISKLGMLVGKNDEAKSFLETFHAEIAVIEEKGSTIEHKKVAYFESIGKKFKTTIPTAFAGNALRIVGLENAAKDIEFDGSTTVVAFGEEHLLAMGNDIEIYIAQKGTMNRAVSLEEIAARPGYDKMKAVVDGHVIIIDEKLVSSATMRYLDGLKELQEKIYGEELE